MYVEFDMFFEKFVWYASLQERGLELMTQDNPSCTVASVAKLPLTKFAHVSNNNQQPYHSAVLSFSL